MKRLTNSVWPVIALGAVLRLWGLGRLCLWYDEAFTAWLARLPWPRLVAATAGDVHPPTWYAIEKVITSWLLGPSEWSLRLPSALLGIANIWLVGLVARAFGLGRRAAWLAAALVAVAPTMIYYAQEARMYQLLTLGVLVMALAVARWRWPMFVAGGLVAVWAHNLGAFYVAALAVASMIQEWRLDTAAGMAGRDWLRWRLWPSAWRVGLAGLLVLVGWLPWLAVVIRQAIKVKSGFWLQPVTLGAWVQSWVFSVWGPVSNRWAALAAVVVALAIVALAIGAAIRENRWALLAWLMLPGLLLVTVSVAWRPVFMDRVLVPVIPALCILLALALDRYQIARRVALPAVPLFGVWLVMFYGSAVKISVPPTKQPIREYAAIICERWEPGDLVFHGNVASYILFDYYLPDLTNGVWDQANDLSQSLTSETKEAMGMNQLRQADLTGYRRLWLIWSETPMTAPIETAVIGGLLRVWPNEIVAVIEDSSVLTAKVYLVDLQPEGEAWRQPH